MKTETFIKIGGKYRTFQRTGHPVSYTHLDVYKRQELSDADITSRSREIAASYQNKKSVVHMDEVDMSQLTLFDTVKEDDIINQITELDLSGTTPIDALNLLYQFQTKLKNRV